MTPTARSREDHLPGFDRISSKPLPEYGATGVRFRHRITGCEVFHLVNDDPENLFALAFRTPPSDNTGAFHILEHAVLCGSERFPLKDPFLVLLQSSTKTFLNAFTFPDKTVYPASSLVEKDFFNLLYVYADAVFFPLLSEEAFMQEAHHVEPVDAEEGNGRLTRTGVVLNEMKGVFSSSESVVARASLHSLFPNSPYGLESGGHPAHIPELTLRQLRDCHRRFYHPANCKIFLYGNVPTRRTLEFLEEHFLARFQPAGIDSSVSPQPRWRQPRRLDQTYPLAEARARTPGGRSTVTLNWLTVPVTDPLRMLSIVVLAELLVGNEGAALQKALLESRLGHDLSPATGLETELGELVFTVGLRGTDPERAGDIERVVLGTLEELVDLGIEEESVQAALHRVEFRNREIQRGGRPYSLVLMRRALRGWLRGEDPETTLEFRRWMDVLKEQVERGRYFESLIEGYLLANPHRSTVIVRPDPEQGPREAEQERRQLQALERSLGEEGWREARQAAERLKKFQEQPDSPEAAARIPALNLEDIRVEVETVPGEFVLPQIGRPVLFHDLFTNAVVYIDLVFDTAGLDDELTDFLPLFTRALPGSGLPGMPYYDVARRLSLLTGGLAAVLSAGTPAAFRGGVRQQLIIRVKLLEQNVESGLELVQRLLLEPAFQDRKRLETIVLEMLNDLKASLVPAGSHYASLRAASRLSAALAVEERWDGIDQVLWLSRLVSGLDGNLDRISASLNDLRAELICNGRLLLNLTCEQGVLDRVGEAAQMLVSSLPSGRPSALGASGPAKETTKQAGALETLLGSMNVSFAAHSLPASAFGSSEHAHETVLAHFLQTGFLWERVRMKGGAYGAHAAANGLESLFTFSSYRDPNLLETLQAFRDALIFASQTDIDAGSFEKIVLGTAGQEDKPLAPGEKGFVALKRVLLGVSDEQRQARRDALIHCTREQMRSAAGRLLEGFGRGFSTLLTHPDALEREKEQLRKLGGAIVELPD
jgi:Zn-dependent M16 (insulinase) family peptidase